MYTITTSMNNLIRCMNRYRTEQLAPLELKSCHAGYLLEICACPGITQEQLSRRIYANKSNVARQLAVLEEQIVDLWTNHAAELCLTTMQEKQQRHHRQQQQQEQEKQE